MAVPTAVTWAAVTWAAAVLAPLGAGLGLIAAGVALLLVHRRRVDV